MFFQWLAKFFLGGGLTGIAAKIEQAYEAKLRAQNDSERIAADQRIAMLEAERDTVLASQSNRIGQLVRAAWALPFLIFNLKVVVFDKVLGLGTTDPLSSHLVWIEGVILSGYFLHAAIGQFRR